MKTKFLSFTGLLVLGFLLFGMATLTSCGSSGNNQNVADSANSKDNTTLLGAGSTFIYPLFSKQFEAYYKLNGLKINYQSIGSGGGILQITNKTIDFGDSDVPMNDDQSAKTGAPMLHIPMASGAAVVSYNLPGLKDTLKLNADVLADIFLGKIKKWNDAKIAAINNGVQLPSLDIAVAHRSDGSGTTYIFVDYLSKISAEWKTKVGLGTALNWPVGIGGKGNEGVAGLIKQTPGAIGYVELAYAIQNNMAFAKLQNKAGNYIAPALASITAAGNIKLPEDAKVSITNTDAPDGYPISSMTWAIIYKEQNYNERSADRAKKLIDLLWWNIHDGQQYCQALNYAPLSPAAVAVAENILKSATYSGKQIKQ